MEGVGLQLSFVLRDDELPFDDLTTSLARLTDCGQGEGGSSQQR